MKAKYKVARVSYQSTKPFILDIHYAKRMPSISYAFGLHLDDDLVGVVTYGSPASPSLCKGVAGIENKQNVIELNRLVLKNNVKNEASFLVSKSLKLLPPSDNLRIISNDNYTLAKMSFDQWNLIFEKEIENKKLNKIIADLNKSPLILATNIYDSQVFFEIQGKNSFYIFFWFIL